MAKSDGGVDCVHYCGFNPLMWVPVWDALTGKINPFIPFYNPVVTLFPNLAIPYQYHQLIPPTNTITNPLMWVPVWDALTGAINIFPPILLSSHNPVSTLQYHFPLQYHLDVCLCGMFCHALLCSALPCFVFPCFVSL